MAKTKSKAPEKAQGERFLVLMDGSYQLNFPCYPEFAELLEVVDEGEVGGVYQVLGKYLKVQIEQLRREAAKAICKPTYASQALIEGVGSLLKDQCDFNEEDSRAPLYVEWRH